MTTLAIKITSPDHDEEKGELQQLEVNHLAVMELDITALRTSRSSSPGVVILLPQSDSFTLIIDENPVLMVPGLVQVLPGSSVWGIQSSASLEDAEAEDPSLKIIELNALINGAIPLREVLVLPTRLHPGESEEAERLWAGFMDEQRRLKLAPGQLNLSRHLGAMRLVELLLSSASINRMPVDMSAWDDRMLRLKTFMLNNLSMPPTTEEMARHLGMSRSSFYRWVVPLLGCSPAQYMRRLRLEKSQEKLRNSSLSVARIAELTGFSSRQHLWQEFTKEYKVTPARLRRAIGRDLEKDSADGVEVLIRDQRYEEALIACRESLRADTPKGSAGVQREDQQARCLYAMGKIKEALAIWQALEDGPGAYQAGTQLCSHYYRCGDFKQAAAALARLFPQATKSQYRELIIRWCHQVAGLVARRMSGPLPDYLDVRRKYFPDNVRSMSVTAEALKGLGQENRVITECPDLRGRHIHSLRRAGLFRLGIEDIETATESVKATTLMLMGKYTKAMELAAHDPALMARALTRLGRGKEAIDCYPDHCQEAYLVLGEYQQLLDRWPRPSEYQVLALAALKRTEALRNYPERHLALWYLAQFHLGPDHFLAVRNPQQPEYHIPALVWQAVRLLAAGEREAADVFLGKIPLVKSSDFWLWPDFSCNETLLTTVTRGLAGNHDLARTELERIFGKLKYTDYQRTWHDAGFLLGQITAETYRKQPCQANLENRLALITALKDDLSNQGSAASYESLLERFSGFYLLSRPQLRALLNWRLQALT